MLIALGLTFILGALIAYEISKNSRHEKAVSDSFWERETKANNTRKKDISSLPYIKVPLDRLPLGLCPAFEELASNEEKLRSLAGQQIYSLAGRSNTDVKLEFGIANFEYLCACDERFLTLIVTLSKEAELLASMSFEEEAARVIEYAISIGSDVPKDYIRLAEYYKNTNNRAALNDLIEKADGLDSLTKASLMEKLEAIADSF